jgi:hypothetical protein
VLTLDNLPIYSGLSGLRAANVTGENFCSVRRNILCISPWKEVLHCWVSCWITNVTSYVVVSAGSAGLPDSVQNTPLGYGTQIVGKVVTYFVTEEKPKIELDYMRAVPNHYYSTRVR